MPPRQFGSQKIAYLSGPDYVSIEIVQGELWSDGPQLTFDHVHLISSDVEASAAWYAAVLGGEVGPVGQTRGAASVPVKFPHSGMSVILRGPRPGEAPLADTGPLHLFAEQEYCPEQKTGEFVSHDELGTEHFYFRVHADLDGFCASVTAPNSSAELHPGHPVELLPGARIAYLLAPDNVSIELVQGPLHAAAVAAL